ncbi:Tyrosine--tRNA ligase [Pantoea agglomerans]|uniref:Tyrosine--tRNA ligase n=1 Tax=Enterobacter agglomerans TaxID=549 RepID=A0A379AGA8_ENTAG|nr:Tyrosine--tRNA ligase [Pantoea agglomerans]
MTSSNLIQQLQERGLIAQVTDEDALTEKLAQGPISLYCGFDPTADSLHLGHLVPLLCLKRFQDAGHKPVALVGGATGLIGDPSFKAAERKLNTSETVNEWVEKIRQQVAPFLDFDCGSNSAIAANNYDWFGGMNVLTFLRDIGKHFSVNQMINKEAVKQRLNRDDQGISFTEFSYNLLQGYDFACLNELHGVSLQIGGSDQWGQHHLRYRSDPSSASESGLWPDRSADHQGLTAPNSVKPKAAQSGWMRRKPARTSSISSGSTPRMLTSIAS